MKQSIIIPHRNRRPYLVACLNSVGASMEAGAAALGEFEVVVVTASTPPFLPSFCSLILDDGHPKVFNKPRLLNLGIAAAAGEVLTFLDCDAIVGPRFLECVKLVDWSAITRLCYRVRYLDRPTSDGVIAGTVDPAGLFAHYDEYPLGFEAYGSHERNVHAAGAEPWGNSQFSISRERLGDLYFDEAYAGRGFEDLHFAKALQEREGDRYRGRIFTDAAHAMLHLRHDYDRDWMRPELTTANLRRYKGS